MSTHESAPKLTREKVHALLTSTQTDRPILAKGWVRSLRMGKKFSFLTLNDGSCVDSLQVVIDNTKVEENTLRQASTGACVAITGQLVQSQGKGQSLEVQLETLRVYGGADPEAYPLQKKAHSLEFLREIAHLRSRTNTFGCVFRLRHGMAWAVHQFFHQRGFYYLHTPIITGSDAEGAGEMFTVTKLPLDNPPRNEAGAVDFGQDFFGKRTHLTVSGQLNGELAALGLGEIYTFGPTFRAENSNTTRHLAEFWMIEPEMAFYDLEDNAQLAQELIHHLVRYALDHHASDLEFLNKTWDDTLLARLEQVAQANFEQMTYTEAVKLLEASGQSFEYPVAWGADLQSEHERWLVEQKVGRPITLMDYPKDIKAFYMRQNDDGKTVAAMDVLAPGIGEIIGGSQREERYDRLLGRIHQGDLPEQDYWWYLDTRKFGTAPHSGFGLGFERLLLFVTGMGNIRDVVPFPRFPGNAEF